MDLKGILPEFQTFLRERIILSCYLLRTNYTMTPEVYLSFRRSYEKTCTFAVWFQRVSGAVAEEGENKDAIPKSSVCMAASLSWTVVT
jgi:hypothetical protein